MRKNRNRALALALALSVTAASLVPAAKAMTIPASYDEAYYATLDYYGGVQEASVVKSYRLNGATTVTDYGTYDEVINLTDGVAPVIDGGKVTFQMGEAAPEKFYFEGKTVKPFEQLPWSIAVSYRLNGAPALAEELAGKTGLVEICLDILPNPAAPAYSRDNLVLTAAAAFNDDDIVSLEAPGAEVQLVGNLRTVLFAALPGEEDHFVIRVGSEDFSFSGLIFLAVPATLQQMEKVADLKQAKEKGEDSLDAISDSLDVILDTLDGMSGSLNATANGLDQLSGARSTVSRGKGEVYDQTDLALEGLNGLVDTLGSMDRYAQVASQAITDLNGDLNRLNATTQGLAPELERARKTIAAIQADTKALSELLTDVESYNKRASAIASSLSSGMEELDDEMEGMRFALDMLESALKSTKGISTIKDSDMLGMLSPDQAAQMKTVLEYRRQYESYLAENGLSETDMSFQDFIVLGAFQQGYEKQVEQTAKDQVAAAYASYVAGVQPGDTPMTPEEFAAGPQGQAIVAMVKQQAEANFQSAYAAFLAGGSSELTAARNQAAAADAAYAEFSAQMPMVDTVNKKIKEINNLITGLTDPTARLVGELSDICELVGDTGTVDDLHSLAKLCRDLLKTLKEHEGEGAALLGDLDEVGDLLSRITITADTALSDLDGLIATLNTYEPELQAAVTDVQSLSASAQTALGGTASAIGSAESLLRQAGPQLDAGTANTLNGLSDALRKATMGLEQTGTIRDAKSTISDLIDDEWDDHSGRVDGILNMDANATPVSMTDQRNAAPRSVQYIMRTQEIKEEKPEQTEEEQKAAEKTTFWERVANLFKGLWADLKKLLHVG